MRQIMKSSSVRLIFPTVVLFFSVLILSSCTGILKQANDNEVLPTEVSAAASSEEARMSETEDSAVPAIGETLMTVPEKQTASVSDEASVSVDDAPTCAAYLEAEIGSFVTFSCYIQGRESWTDNFCSLYAQDETGACYLVRLPCTKEDYDRMTPGRMILVTGYKSTWGDDIELTDCSFQFLDGSWLANPQDMTDLLGTEELSVHRNEKVCFSGMKIEPMMDGASVWYCGWDNMAAEGENTEFFFRASAGEAVCMFSVLPSLCENPEQVIQTLKSLHLDDVVDLTGYLYWYNGPRPRIIEIFPDDVR